VSASFVKEQEKGLLPLCLAISGDSIWHHFWVDFWHLLSHRTMLLSNAASKELKLLEKVRIVCFLLNSSIPFNLHLNHIHSF